MTSRNHRRIALVLLCFGAIYLIWGSTYAAVRVAVSGLPPYLMNATRCALGGVALYAFLRLRGVRDPGWSGWQGPVLSGALMLGGASGLVCWAEQRVDSSVAAMMMATVPVWMVLMEWIGFGGRRPGALTLVGLGLGFVGVAVLCAPSGGGVLPVLALALAAPLWCTGSLVARHGSGRGDTTMVAAQQLLAGAAVLLIVGLLRGEAGRLALAEVAPSAWLGMAYLAIFGSIVALTAYGWLLRNVGPASTATYAFVNPVVALLIGTLWLGERLSVRSAAGAGLVLLAVVIVLLRAARRPAAAPGRPARERAPARAPTPIVTSVSPRP